MSNKITREFIFVGYLGKNRKKIPLERKEVPGMQITWSICKVILSSSAETDVADDCKSSA